MSLIVIAGPTSTGKTSKALELCKAFDGVIISADSRQIVRSLDIGTGKVPISIKGGLEKTDDHYLLNGIKIYGYDLINPNENYSAFMFADYFRKLYKELSAHYSHVFLVGGSGFYIDACLGLINLEFSDAPKSVKDSLMLLSLEEKIAELERLDPMLATSIDLKNPYRVQRTLEKLLSPKRSNEVVVKSAKDFLPDKYLYLVLSASRDILYKRVDAWAQNIWTDELFSEYRIVKANYPKNKYLDGLVYKNVGEFLAGLKTSQKALTEMQFSLHGYIRRQETWFKRNLSAVKLDISKPSFDVDLTTIVKSYVNG